MYPATVGLMVDYVMDLVNAKRPKDTQAPIPLTLETIEASNRYRHFFMKESCILSSQVSLMSRTLLQVHIVIPWKASASIMSIGSEPTPQFRCTASNASTIVTSRLIVI